MDNKQYRNIMKFISRHTNDPYYSVREVINKYGETIPLVRVKPLLSEYGLPEDIEVVLRDMEERYNSKRSRLQYLFFYVSVSLAIISFFYIAIEQGNPGAGIGYAILVMISYFFIAAFLEGIFKYRKNTELHKKFFEYKKQLDLYNYWLQMNSINYWMNLDGHKFEEAVARVYRKHGYIAKVSKQGGDGGIDITLTKGNQRIAVQCKAHKKPVGPAVARDLFGTMDHFGFSDGILVSRNGFTVGVYEFVKDKPIKLVNLNNIMEMTN